MKNFRRVLTLVALSTALAAFAGCSSGKLASGETPEVPVEANAGGDAFNSVANSDIAPTPTTGAVIDTAPPAAVIASAEATPEYKSQSPVNLGASSAGRAH